MQTTLTLSPLLAILCAALPARAAEEPTTITIAGPDHKVELTARVGLLAGGELTPKNQLIGKTSATPLFLMLDSSFITHPFFTIGAYMSFSSAGYQQYLYDDAVSDGHVTFFSTGAIAKARFQLSDSVTLRAGAALGINHQWASVTRAGATFDVAGTGLNLAPSLELSVRVSKSVALSGQFSFMSQMAGSADLGEKSTDFKFPPLIFFAFGPEFFL